MIYWLLCLLAAPVFVKSLACTRYNRSWMITARSPNRATTTGNIWHKTFIRTPRNLIHASLGNIVCIAFLKITQKSKRTRKKTLSSRAFTLCNNLIRYPLHIWRTALPCRTGELKKNNFRELHHLTSVDLLIANELRIQEANFIWKSFSWINHNYCFGWKTKSLRRDFVPLVHGGGGMYSTRVRE